jgi:hypothetical protein
VPASGGITTTLLLIMTEQAYTSGQGTATTGHGARISAKLATEWVTGETRVLPIRMRPTKEIAGYGTSHRLFTETQRLAMIARDQGCSFPGCTAPPLWCQSHHILDYAKGGRTSVDAGCLLCGFHHDHFAAFGWTCRMINGIPHWIPPTWIDAQQRPRRNHAHDPDVAGPRHERPTSSVIQP